jgi:hypothetical protein
MRCKPTESLANLHPREWGSQSDRRDGHWHCPRRFFVRGIKEGVLKGGVKVLDERCPVLH